MKSSLSDISKVTKDPRDDEDFYQELDEKRSHKSCCSVQTLIIFFVFVFIILVGTTFYLYYQITRGGLFANWNNKISVENVTSNINNLKPNDNNQVEITLTSDEISALLSSGISADKFVLNNFSCSINPSNILFYGNLTKPIGARVVFTAVPKVVDGRVNFEVEKASAGKINLPAFLNRKIAERLNENFDAKMSLFYAHYSVEKVTLMQNQMTIGGNIK